MSDATAKLITSGTREAPARKIELLISIVSMVTVTSKYYEKMVLLHLRGHLQTDFGTLNVIMTLTSDLPPSPFPTSHYENNALAIEAQNVIFFT